MNDPLKPYLSVVVTGRNDDHGGRFLDRFQLFSNNLLTQLSEYRLPSELIVVEWNPPHGKPSLKDTIDWPLISDYCQVRFITVPEEIHRRFRFSDQLPLFQMIAKNVGIRRAKGRFILATNIDLLFSTKLIAFLARQKLSDRKFYRVDRYDVPVDVLGAPLTPVQLDELCKKAAYRVNLRAGTFKIPYVFHDSKFYGFKFPRYTISINHEIGHRLVMDFVNFIARLVGLRIRIQKFFLMKIYRNWRVAMRGRGPRSKTAAAGAPHFFQRLWQFEKLFVSDLAAAFVKRYGRLKMTYGRFITNYNLLRTNYGRFVETNYGRFKRTMAKKKVASKIRSKKLHTNACGDFTLLAKDAWFELKGYPELEMFSIHLDSVFCYAAHWGGIKEDALSGWKMIYHIDHFSGWSPDQIQKVIRKMAEKKVPLLSNEKFKLWTRKMAREKRPLIFNDDHWGLDGIPLKETAVYDEEGNRRVRTEDALECQDKTI